MTESSASARTSAWPRVDSPVRRSPAFGSFWAMPRRGFDQAAAALDQIPARGDVDLGGRCPGLPRGCRRSIASDGRRAFAGDRPIGAGVRRGRRAGRRCGGDHLPEALKIAQVDGDSEAARAADVRAPEHGARCRVSSGISDADRPSGWAIWRCARGAANGPGLLTEALTASGRLSARQDIAPGRPGRCAGTASPCLPVAQSSTRRTATIYPRREREDHQGEQPQDDGSAESHRDVPVAARRVGSHMSNATPQARAALPVATNRQKYLDAQAGG